MFSKTQESHLKDVKAVLELLQTADLRLKLTKCKFFKSSVTFLGNVIFTDGHAICPDKLQAIRDFFRPTNTTQVRSFVGTVNFLRKFCKGLLQIAALLTALQGKAPFSWNDTHELAFQIIKSKLLEAPVLSHPDSSKQFILETDASNYAIGAVLLQADAQIVKRPVTYFS